MREDAKLLPSEVRSHSHLNMQPLNSGKTSEKGRQQLHIVANAETHS
jgi:hypothetical protein